MERFKKVIQNRVGQQGDELVDKMKTVPGFSKERLQGFRESLSKHIDEPTSNTPPEGALTGAYDQEAIERWQTAERKDTAV